MPAFPNPMSQIPNPTAGWQGFYGPAGTQIVVMPSNALPSPVRNAIGHYPQRDPSPSPTSRIENVEGPKLRKWLKMLDEAQKANSDDPDDSEDSDSDVSESYSSYLPAMKKAGLKRVKDLMLFKSDELETTLQCSIGTAKRLQELAKQHLKRL